MIESGGRCVIESDGRCVIIIIIIKQTETTSSTATIVNAASYCY